jgi:hypothetical protein
MSYRLSSLAEQDLVQHDVVLRRPESGDGRPFAAID